MKALAKLKQDLEAVENLGSVIDALKTAALVQFRVFQNREKLNEAYLKELEDAFDWLILRNVFSPYFRENENLAQALVIVTSDEGFLGELNTLCINAALERRESKRDELIVLGERGARYLEDKGEHFAFFAGITEAVEPKEAERLISYLLKRYDKNIGRVNIIYPQFLSLTSQQITIFPLLPYSFKSARVETYRRLAYRRSRWEEEVIFEPSIDNIAGTVINFWLNYKFLEIFSSAKQAELAARIMHLEGSTQELALLDKRIRLSYFKQRHAFSDKTIREIFAAKILLKNRA